MKRELRESTNRLQGLFASARGNERSDEALEAWTAARRCLDATSDLREENDPMQRLDACLASLESVVRAWSTCGFEGSFRLAGVLLDAAWSRASEAEIAVVRQAA